MLLWTWPDAHLINPLWKEKIRLKIRLFSYFMVLDYKSWRRKWEHGCRRLISCSAICCTEGSTHPGNWTIDWRWTLDCYDQPMMMNGGLIWLFWYWLGYRLIDDVVIAHSDVVIGRFLIWFMWTTRRLRSGGRVTEPGKFVDQPLANS